MRLVKFRPVHTAFTELLLNSAGEYTIVRSRWRWSRKTNPKFDLQVVDPRPPKLDLNGDEILRMSSLKPYVDPGFSAFDAEVKI